MNGKGGSSLGTFLFSIPLAAIPLMAIFGIPQFAPLAASPDRADGYDQTRNGHHLDDGREPDDRSYRRKAADVLRSRGYETSVAENTGHSELFDDRSSRDQRGDDRIGERGDLGSRFGTRPSEPADDDAPASRGDGQGTVNSIGRIPAVRPNVDSEADVQTVAEMTWQSAAERLQDLGISSYHLEPGAEVGSFLFVCSFCPEANSNITMRFEAESAEPLDAVDNVLAQIDHWQQQQSR